MFLGGKGADVNVCNVDTLLHYTHSAAGIKDSVQVVFSQTSLLAVKKSYCFFRRD